MARIVSDAFMRFLKVAFQVEAITYDDPTPSGRRLSKGFIMPQGQQGKSQSQKIEDARDLQAKLYREIGISAVAAALRFASQPDPFQSQPQMHPVPGVLRGEELAA